MKCSTCEREEIEITDPETKETTLVPVDAAHAERCKAAAMAAAGGGTRAPRGALKPINCFTCESTHDSVEEVKNCAKTWGYRKKRTVLRTELTKKLPHNAHHRVTYEGQIVKVDPKKVTITECVIKTDAGETMTVPLNVLSLTS